MEPRADGRAEGRGDAHAFRIPRVELNRFAEIVGARGYSTSEALRILIRRVNRGSIRLQAKVTEHAVQDLAAEAVA